MKIDPRDPGPVSVYRLLGGCVVPRPIAWVSTIDPSGRPNLAPFSFFMGVAATPPMVAISVLPSQRGAIKDTVVNVRSTGELVINVVSEDLVERMNITSAPYPHGENEFERAGLTASPSERVRPPRVAESPVALECTVEQAIDVRDGASTLVIAEVVFLHIRDDLYQDGEVDVVAMRPASRLNKDLYAIVKDAFSVKRPVRP